MSKKRHFCQKIRLSTHKMFVIILFGKLRLQIKNVLNGDFPLSDRGMTNLGQEWSFFCGSITNLGQERVCLDRIEHAYGRQSTLADWRITNPGQERVCFDRIKHSDGRQSTIADGRMTNLGQEWSFFCRSITNLGQKRVCHAWIKHSVARQRAYEG